MDVDTEVTPFRIDVPQPAADACGDLLGGFHIRTAEVEDTEQVVGDAPNDRGMW